MFVLHGIQHSVQPRAAVDGGAGPRLALQVQHPRPVGKQTLDQRALHLAGMDAFTVATGAAGTVRDTIFLPSDPQATGLPLK